MIDFKGVMATIANLQPAWGRDKKCQMTLFYSTLPTRSYILLIMSRWFGGAGGVAGAGSPFRAKSHKNRRQKYKNGKFRGIHLAYFNVSLERAESIFAPKKGTTCETLQYRLE